MQVRLGLVTALSLPLLFVFPIHAQTAPPTAADITAAYQLYKTGHLPEALAKYKAILASNPSADLQQQALFWQGIVQESSGLADDAVASFESLASTSPDYRWPEVLNKLALKYRAKGDSVKEKYFFDQLQQRRTTSAVHADKARADLLIGDYFKQTGDWGKAYDQFQRIQAAYPEFAQDILFQIAYTAHSAGKYTEAITAGQAYVAKYPTSPQFEEAAFRVVEDLNYANRYKEALDTLNNLGVNCPNLSTHVQVVRAEILAEGLKDPNGSNIAAQQVIDENKDPYQTYLAKYQIAFNLLYKLKDYAKARPILMQIVDLYPKDNLAIEIASDIASSYNVEGRHLQAIEAYKQALAKYPCPVSEWDAWIRYMIGHSYHLAKDDASARTAWKELEALHPDSDWTRISRADMARWAS